MLALVNSVWDCWLKWLCCEVEIITQTALQPSFIIWIYELYGNELVILLSFVSSNNTDKETAEQFITLYTRYVCDLSGLTSFSISETLETWRKLKKTFLSYFLFLTKVFLLSTHEELLSLSTERSFALRVCLLIPKVNYRTVNPEKMSSWPPICFLLASDHEKVANFFIREECWLFSALSEWVGDLSSSGSDSSSE